jgi:processive 1,2-diacylglycerol beta-glucosyltransferase
LKIFIVHATAGAGHLKAAEALYKAFLDAAISDVEVKKIDALDYTDSFFKKAYPAVYIFLVKYLSFLWGIFFHALDIGLLKPLINKIRHFFNAFFGRKLVNYVLNEKPDIIICEHFLSAELMSNLKKQGRFTGKVFVGVTDFGVHQFWVNEGTDAYFVASEKTRDELNRQGIHSEKIFVTGIPVEKKFSQSLKKDEVYSKLGLSKDKFTVLVTSGGFGVGPIKKIVSCLDAMDRQLQVLVICGRNKELPRFFSKQKFKKTVKVFGFVNNMEEFMEAAELIISKSGGLTVSESLVKGLPMIIIKPIPGQEMKNAQIIEEYNIGLRLTDLNELRSKIEMLLANDGKILREMHENALKLAKPHAAQGICNLVMKGF